MKVAVIQTNAKNKKEHNLKRAVSLVKRAAGNNAEFILLPEAFNFRGRLPGKSGLASVAENIPGPSTKLLMALAKKHRVTVLAGTVCERIPGSKKVFNTSVLIGPDGRIRSKYRKMNLFDAVIGSTKLRESRRFRAGNKPVTADVNGWKAGLSICYDLRFPKLYEMYAQRGAEILCVPSAFTKKTGSAHWETLLRARAIENLCYVLAPNQIGKDGFGVPSYGHSMIIDPWGKVLARASGSKEEVLYAILDRRHLKAVRKILPGQSGKKG